MSRPEGSARHLYRPTEGHGLRRSPFNALVAPRPIGWISTLLCRGRPEPGALQLLHRVQLQAAEHRGQLGGLPGLARERRGEE
nr:hypothetical protein [Micrococcus cohnii]